MSDLARIYRDLNRLPFNDMVQLAAAIDEELAKRKNAPLSTAYAIASAAAAPAHVYSQQTEQEEQLLSEIFRRVRVIKISTTGDKKSPLWTALLEGANGSAAARGASLRATIHELLDQAITIHVLGK